MILHQPSILFSGPAESRTPVRTRKPYAFYTFIPAFDFRMSARPGPPTDILSSKFHLGSEAYPNYFRFNLHRFTLRFGTTSLEQCLVQLSNSRIKPVIYCTSIRQRERNCFRQLIFRYLRFGSQSTMLRVLTYHLVLPSNPNKPM